VTLDDRTLQELIDLTRKGYPDWEGFSDERFLRDEIDYKRAAIARAADMLEWSALKGMMLRGEHDEFIGRLEVLGRSANLLFNAAPSRGDLSILHHPRLDKGAFCEAMVNLLYGPGSSTERLEHYAAFVTARELPNKWTFPTYFLFLCHPESEIFVKPTTTRWMLELFGKEAAWRATPHPRSYAVILRVAHELRGRLAGYGARDMVDVQSILWVASQQADHARYWKISPGENAWQWEECRRGNFIGVGWEMFGDISRMSRAEFDTRHQEILRSFPELANVPAWKKRAVAQLWSFARIRQGDVIVANRGTTEVLGVGRVAGPYYYVPGQSNGHRLPVIWRDTPRQVEEEGWRRTLMQLDPGTFTSLNADPPAAVAATVAEEEAIYRPAIAPETSADAPAYVAEPEIQPDYPLENLAHDTGADPALLERWGRAIERKGQAILFGPPGTGKTFIAGKLARHIVGGTDGFIDLLQLHPAYAYEDFVLGIRPKARPEGGLDYPLVPGRFLQFCQEASRRSGRCVLVIDEINRANLSRVFGELMYLLEYRSAEIPLAGGLRFAIPENVRIIGTMNTADRSIALVDNALRRRFAFLALRPDYEILRRYHQREKTSFAVDRLVEVMRRLNRQINNPHFEIGISYFLRRDLDDQIEDIWRMEIEPYIEEYFFDQPGKVEEFRWENVEETIRG